MYAVDYSEPETPLVGQGLLSWSLESMRNEFLGQPSKMVTGRVTKNLLAVFGGGNREFLEVKLKLTASTVAYRPESQASMDMQPSRSMEQAMTPTGAAEWNSFIQSNPQIGHSGHISRVASPALSQAPSFTMNRRDSFGPASQTFPQQEIQKVAPVPIEPSSTNPAQPGAPTSRPSSRASRRRAPTGRPRGRPRKKPVEGNTSGYEDGTEGEEGPSKKRAKITKVEKSTAAPFGAGPDSLRVAASTSGSIRNFRPIAVSTEAGPGNHLQEVPRAPTPVPEGPLGLPGRGSNASKLRREAVKNQEIPSNLPNKPGRALSPSQEDGRSPESLAPTPHYSEGSPADIGSSPPMPRAVPFLRSSPPPSSPILPPMPVTQIPRDASFMSTDIDDLFDEESLRPLREELKYSTVRPAVETTDASGIPIQVFQMKNGPNGQDMVHIRSYNTPQPTSTPAAPPADIQSLPPLRKESSGSSLPTKQAARKQSRLPSPPALAPTPPPTTDAAEKLASPAPTEPLAEVTQLSEALNEKPILEESVSKPEKPTIQSKPKANPKPARHMNRSQSTGALVLPSIPASEPIGPSSLSQATVAEPRAQTEVPTGLRRSNSTGPLLLPIPASDPAGPTMPSLQSSAIIHPEPTCPPSDVIPVAPSSPQNRSNKNLVKKQSIKQRLEEAVQNGEMPPFCTNCGAIETPTWRKIWIQDLEGVPAYFEYSEKPGRVTAVDILKRDHESKPLLHRLIKKSLGTDDDKSVWQEQLLCNPCGIWLVKCKSHRPEDRWGKDAARLGQERRKRGANGTSSRSKKARTKSDAQTNLTSEAYPQTDPLGPTEPSSPTFADAATNSHAVSRPASQGHESTALAISLEGGDVNNETNRSNPGSTHSRGDGSAKSPIELDTDEQLGSTKRLLFPSPKKDSSPKVLGEVDVNIVQTIECRLNKEQVVEKENTTVGGGNETQDDDLEALFRSPAIDRPSTPPPNAKSAAQAGPFKTPTRPTPSHRPVTRSVSRSLRSNRSFTSPSQALALLQQTPTKTPRGSLAVPGSASRRRSPRNHQVNFDSVFDTPISRTINQLLSEPNFDINNHDVDLSSLPMLEGGPGGFIDFGNLLSTDGAMPSSPPKGESLGFDYAGSANLWAQWSMDHSLNVEESQNQE